MTSQKEETVIIYTHPDCSYSGAAKDQLNELNIPFKEIDVSLSPDYVVELERLTGGEKITPVIVEGDRVTVGFQGVG